MGGVGQRIRELRKAAKLTQQEVAEGVVTRSYISQIEKGLIQPSYDTLRKLAAKLNCEVEEFFKEPENTAILIAEWKKFIRFAEGQAESGQFEQAHRTLESSNIDTSFGLNDYDLGLLTWVKGKLLELKNPVQAEIHYRESLGHLEHFMYSKERVRSLYSLGYVISQQGRNEEALQVLNESYRLVIHHQIGGLLKISVLVNLGIVHGKLREYHSAMRLLHEADEINKATSNHFKAGHILMSLANCSRNLCKWSEARDLYLRAIDFYNSQDDRLNKAVNFTNLGILYRECQQYNDSIEALQTAIQLLSELDATPKLANAKLEISQSFLHANDWEQATKFCLEAREDNTDQRCQAIALRLLGTIECNKQNYGQALEHLEASLKLSTKPEDVKMVVTKLAEIHYELGNYETAAGYYQQIQKTGPVASLV